jgi:hypothetical protein
MLAVSTTGIAVSLKTELRFPTPGQQGHGSRIIQQILVMENLVEDYRYFLLIIQMMELTILKNKKL